MDERVQVFLKELNDELRDAILPYWMERMVDHGQGGFYGRIDGRNNLHSDAPRGSVLNARILWTFSAAYNYYHDPKYLKMADRAYRYCVDYFFNTENSGVHWMVDHRGQPLESKNQIYALGFMIYGFSEYYMASGHDGALQKSQQLFDSIERHSFDREFNGYLEAFDAGWKLLDDLRLSEKDANEKKTMNTHLHILEGYTNLFRIWEDETLKMQLRNLIHLFMNRIVDPETNHFRLFFDERWKPRDEEISFGHDIEGSWLIREAAEVLGDRSLIEQSGQLALRMVESVLINGFDDDNGLLYEVKSNGAIDYDKHWWPQAEAMVGLVNAYQVSQDEAYLDRAMDVWDFVKKHVIDTDEGEWFFRVDKYGRPYPEEDKAGFWKCPYHNSRACLEIMRRLG